MIQLTRSGTTYAGTAEDLQRLRELFDRQHCIRLHQLLEPGLLRVLQRQIEQAEFFETVHEDEGDPPPIDLCMRPNAASHALHLVVNEPCFLRFLEQVTGCGGIGCFLGTVFRRVRDANLYDWHNDLVEDRMLAMSINLSTGVYRGGTLQLRDAESGRVVHEVANTGFGDATIFRIARCLEHRVSPVEGPVARSAFAGWFRPQPDYRSWLQESLAGLLRP
jgi:hypothetical protein